MLSEHIAQRLIAPKTSLSLWLVLTLVMATPACGAVREETNDRP